MTLQKIFICSISLILFGLLQFCHGATHIIKDGYHYHRFNHHRVGDRVAAADADATDIFSPFATDFNNLRGDKNEDENYKYHVK